MGKIKSIKASTLPETIISLVILLTSFSIAFSLMVNLFKETISEKETLIHLKLSELKNKTIHEKRFFDETIDYENYILIKKITPSELNPDLILLQFFALNEDNDTIEKQQRFIYLPDLKAQNKLNNNE